MTSIGVHLLTTVLLTALYSVSAEPIPSLELETRQSAPVCTDGGTLYCCQATFSGGLLPVVLASNLTCYDLTPEVVNCIISMSSLPRAGPC